MPVTPYLTTTDPNELLRFGLDPTTISEPLLLDATLLVIAYMGCDLSAQQFVDDVELSDGSYGFLKKPPIISIDAATGRYLPVSNSERRNALARYAANQQSYFMTEISTLGGVPKDVVIDPATIDMNPRTGRIWIPTSLYMTRYSEVTVTYTAGYATIPDQVKNAIAKLIPSLQIRPNSMFTRLVEGDQEASFTPGFIPEEVRMMLDDFKKQWKA